MHRYWSIGCWVLLILVLATNVAMAETRLGIFAGANEGYPSEVRLKYAVSDAKKMKRVFVAYGQMAKENALLLTDCRPADILTAIASTKKQIAKLKRQNERVVLVFYFNGHGDRGYLHPGGEDFSKTVLMDSLKSLGADLVLCIIDACQTEHAQRAKGIRTAPRFDISAASLETHEGVVTIQSTMEGRPAYESDALQSALFTHYFVSALQGAADTNHDRRITLLEAYSHAYRETVQASAMDSQVIQQPHFDMTFRGAGDLVLTDMERADSWVTIVGNTDARYVFFSKPQGQPVAEIFVAQNERVSVALAHGPVLIQKRTVQGAYAAEAYVPRKGSLDLPASQFKRIHLEDHTLKGGGNLFPHQLSAGYVFSLEQFIDGWRPLHGASLGYQHHFEKMVLLVASEFQFGSFESEVRTSQEFTLAGFAMVGRKVGFERFALLLSVGPGVQFYRQKSTLRNVERLQNAGFEVTVNSVNFAIAPAGKFSAEGQWLLRRRLGGYVRAEACGAYYSGSTEDSNTSHMRWLFNGAAGLYLRF